MGVEHRIWYDGEFVRVEHAPGFRITSELMETVWRELSDACLDNACRCVLIEGEAPRRDLRPVEALDSAADAARRVPGLTLALCLSNYVTDQTTELFKLAMSRRGCRVSFFSDPTSAIEWLRSSEI